MHLCMYWINPTIYSRLNASIHVFVRNPVVILLIFVFFFFFFFETGSLCVALVVLVLDM
jgi:hypothetical protein